MLQYSKQADERREAGPVECWCLHGAVGAAGDWREFAGHLAGAGIGSRAVDLWRFPACGPLTLAEFGRALDAEAGGEVFRGSGRVLLGYSMGGRLALHALLEQPHPWQAAVIISAHPGLEDAAERSARTVRDTEWAAKAFTGAWDAFLTEWDAQPVLQGASIREPAASRQLAMRRGEVARSFLDWSLGQQAPLWDRLREITVPVLWIAGERDGKFRALAERAVSLTPNGSIAIAPGAGHRVPWDHPEWLAKTVAGFARLGGHRVSARGV
jgi:2-succinyl-6-hydroxy-2,4-cyclohexadiene-1-carboxylate synthase